MIFRAEGRSVDEITIGGVWLGVVDVIPNEMAQVQEFTLAPGDHMLLYTDGIVETLRGEEMFGIARLKTVFSDVATDTPEVAVSAIFRAVHEFGKNAGTSKGGSDREDDMTLLALKYTGKGFESARSLAVG